MPARRKYTKPTALHTQEYELLKHALRTNGNQKAAALALGIPRTVFMYKLNRLATLHGDEPSTIRLGLTSSRETNHLATTQAALLLLAESTMDQRAFYRFTRNLALRLELVSIDDPDLGTEPCLCGSEDCDPSTCFGKSNIAVALHAANA